MKIHNTIQTSNMKIQNHPQNLKPLPKSQIGNRKSKLARGFTLVEIMLVVAIIGILAALVVPRIAGKSEEAKETAAQADIKGGIKTALDEYNVDMGVYPQSLQDLLQRPRNAKSWHGPYLDSLPVDPWQNPYSYSYPGKHNGAGYDLWSGGPDGKHEIGNW